MSDLYYRPRRKRVTRLRKWAHRKGIARNLNITSSSIYGLQTEYVETALPSRLLAWYAAAHYGMRIESAERWGHFRRRWNLRVIR